MKRNKLMFVKTGQWVKVYNETIAVAFGFRDVKRIGTISYVNVLGEYRFNPSPLIMRFEADTLRQIADKIDELNK